MTQDNQSPGGSPAVSRRRVQWTVWFFVGWTIFAVAAAAWLLATANTHSGVLIRVNPGETLSAFARVREWCQANVDLSWAYAWLLLAPYVFWLGMRLRIESRGLALRAGLLLLAGAGFVAGSQAFTRRIGGHSPRTVAITASATVHQGALNLTNQRRMVVITGRPGRGTNDLLLANDLPPPEEADHLALEIAQNLRPMVEQLRGAMPPMLTNRVPAWSYALDGLAYLCLIGLAQAVQTRRHLRERERQAELLAGQLNQARLRTLQAQLQPHFLFNALNGIAALIRSQPRVAEEMVTSLSELLRLALSQSGRQQIPLRQELEFLDRYLEIQQMRFGDRLSVERALAPDTLDCLVPSLLLQPLVENAIRHGIEPSAQPGVVRLAAQIVGNRLEIHIADNGVGLPAGGTGDVPGNVPRGTGLGLASVRERLFALYGPDQECKMISPAGGGVEVSLSLPRQMAPPEVGNPAA